MLKADLVKELVKRRGLTTRQATVAIDQIFDSMLTELARGASIELRGFGAFHVRAHNGYTGTNPKTARKIHVAPKRAVQFRMSKEMRERVNLRPITGAETARAQRNGATKDPEGEENAA